MSGEELITQSKWGSKTRFNFGEEKLEYSLRNFSGEATGTQPYTNINLENKSTLTVNVAGRFYYIIVVGGFLASLLLQIAGAGLRGAAWLPLILAILTYFTLRYFRLMTVTFTTLRPTSGAGNPIRIIHDEKHDEVLRRIKSGWVARMRKLYLAVNIANDVKLEANKYKWLLDHGVISDTEYQDAMAQLCPPVAQVSPVSKEHVLH